MSQFVFVDVKLAANGLETFSDDHHFHVKDLNERGGRRRMAVRIADHAVKDTGWDAKEPRYPGF